MVLVSGPLFCMAILSLILYSLRQLLTGIWRDNSSPHRVPPRAITGESCYPVLGHTLLFMRHGARIASLFKPTRREWICFPKFCSRRLKDVFSIFLWGQWRVVINNPNIVRRIFDEEVEHLEQGWAWTPPVSLLGKSCVVLSKNDEKQDLLKSLIGELFQHENVVRFASQFAEIAECCLKDLSKDGASGGGATFQLGKWRVGDDDDADKKLGSSDKTSHEDGPNTDEHPTETHQSTEDSRTPCNIDFDFLRSYTFELVNGPILQLNIGNESIKSYATDETCSHSTEGGDSTNGDSAASDSASCEDKTLQRLSSPNRDEMLRWIKRLKKGLLSVKITMGKEWMQMWRLNSYGRAVNARMHIDEIVSQVVSEQNRLHPGHVIGDVIREPLTASIPYYAFLRNSTLNNAFRITSDGSEIKTMRSIFTGGVQEGKVVLSEIPEIDDDDNDDDVHRRTRTDSTTVQSSHHPRVENDDITNDDDTVDLDEIDLHDTLSNVAHKLSFSPATKPNSVRRIASESKLTSEEHSSECSSDNRPSKSNQESILSQLLEQRDKSNKPLTQTVISEISILLWMIMDAGNAWTSMALYLLSHDNSARLQIQHEIDFLVEKYGRQNLFTESVLSKMRVLDALLYEAIRLTPPFFGGLRVLRKTLELDDLKLQIPRGTGIFFSHATSEKLDLSQALGRTPEDLGRNYPCPDLYGFLPLSGLEIPMMVLQSKVFLIVLLQQWKPVPSNPVTFVEKVCMAIKKTVEHTIDKTDGNTHVKTPNRDEKLKDMSACEIASSLKTIETVKEEEDEVLSNMESGGVGTQQDIGLEESMHWFSQIPFPEPRLDVGIRFRDDVCHNQAS